MVDVRLNYAAVFALTNDADGPVGELVLELAERAAVVARSVVRVRHTRTWSDKSTARPPGFTRAGIRPDIGYDAAGLIYGAVLAPYQAGFYLEYPREDRTWYPFLSIGIDSLTL